MYFYSLYNRAYWLPFGSPVPEIVSLFSDRVTADSGNFEAPSCLESQLDVLNGIELLDTASLIVTPNAYKEGKLYSVIPSDGSGDLSVTRATTATRVNSQGLVELVPYNLLTYSERFDNAVWQKLMSSTITADTTTAPNGTLTADTYTASNQSYGRILRQPYSGYVIGNTYTSSFYIKKTNWRYIGLRISLSTAPTDRYPFYDFDTDTFNTLGIANATMSRQILDDGWIRISLTYTTPSTSSSTDIAIVSSDGAISTALTGTESVYLWGAQLVEGTEAKDYQRTETRLNIPRLDYSLGSCPSILVEPQRTNLAKFSEQFDNAAWTKNNSSITANATISPDGITNADSLVENTATNLHLAFQFFTSVSLATYSFSCYIKPDTRTRAYLRSDTSVGTRRTLFDLTGAGSVVTLSHDSATITAVGNGWYRATITFSEVIGLGSRLVAIEGAVGTNINYTGNGLTAFYLYGAQLEASAYATSYIPTTSASVTRNNEIYNKTSISSLIGQTEGTIFVDFTAQKPSELRRISISDGTLNNRIVIVHRTTGELQFIVVNGGVTQADFITSQTYQAGEQVKVAIAYKANDFIGYINGTQTFTDTSGSVPATSRFGFTDGDGTSFPFVASVKVSALWKERFTNEQLAQLTTI